MVRSLKGIRNSVAALQDLRGDAETHLFCAMCTSVRSYLTAAVLSIQRSEFSQAKLDLAQALEIFAPGNLDMDKEWKVVVTIRAAIETHQTPSL